MIREYRVVDCRAGADDEGILVKAASPEAAALLVFDEPLMRGGKSPDLRARVYSRTGDGPLSMVRLYARAARQS